MHYHRYPNGFKKHPKINRLYTVLYVHDICQTSHKLHAGRDNMAPEDTGVPLKRIVVKHLRSVEKKSISWLFRTILKCIICGKCSQIRTIVTKMQNFVVGSVDPLSNFGNLRP